MHAFADILHLLSLPSCGLSRYIDPLETSAVLLDKAMVVVEICGVVWIQIPCYGIGRSAMTTASSRKSPNQLHHLTYCDEIFQLHSL